MICDDDSNDCDAEACEVEDGGYYVCDLGSWRDGISRVYFGMGEQAGDLPILTSGTVS